MFSTFLRFRSDLAFLIPTLTSPKSSLRETSLHAHDLAIPIPSRNHSDQPSHHPPNKPPTLQCLLLTSLSLSPTHRSEILQRIERLTTLATSRALTAIIFLLDPGPDSNTSGLGDGAARGFEAYMELQVLVEGMGLGDSPVLLPCPRAERLLEMVKGYAGSLRLDGVGEGDGHGADAGVYVRRDLLAQATCTAPTKPLPEHTTFVLGDIARSLGDVAIMATTGSGKRKLAEFLDEREVRDISDFWTEEWIAD